MIDSVSSIPSSASNERLFSSNLGEKLFSKIFTLRQEKINLLSTLNEILERNYEAKREIR